MRLKTKGKINFSLLCGILGCFCFGVGDWLMLYGDTAYRGSLSWLTVGAAEIAPWRNTLAMALAFPGMIFYGIALFAIAAYLKEERQRKVYHYLTAFSLTPWLALHLFYIMILYAFAWMSRNGYEAAALPVSEALFAHLSWLVIVSEALMLPPLYLLALDAGARQQRISKGDGFLQPADILCAFEAADHADAGQRVPAGLHQRPDEREHAALVWQYAAMELAP